jgi:hypothetical protein
MFHNYKLTPGDLTKMVTAEDDVYGKLFECEPDSVVLVWQEGAWREFRGKRFFVPMLEQVGWVGPPPPPEGMEVFTCQCEELSGYYAVPKASDCNVSYPDKELIRTEALNFARILMGRYGAFMNEPVRIQNLPEEIARISITCAKAVVEGTR